MPPETVIPPTSSQESPSTSPQTPQTPTPVVQPTNNDSQIKLYEDVIRDSNRRIQELEDQLNQSRKPQTPPKTEISAEEYYKDPVAANRRLIAEAMQETVAPLLDYVSTLKAGSKVDSLISQFKSDSRFAGQWNSTLENYVRTEASKMSDQQLSSQTVGAIVLVGLGMQTAGLLPGSTPASVPQTLPQNPPTQPQNTMPQPPRDTIPPYMQPSGTPAPQNNNGGTRRIRELTENEMRLARERRQTPEQYLQWLEVSAQEVVGSDIGRPPKGGQ